MDYETVIRELVTRSLAVLQMIQQLRIIGGSAFCQNG